MKILVTGGTGFTGKALVLRLIADGHQVVALDYKPGLATEELSQAGADVIIGSVTDAAIVRQAVQGCEVVHHLAAAFREMNVPQSHYDDVNVGGTKIVLDRGAGSSESRPVTLGIRPEHFQLDPNGLPAELLTVEPTGSETQVVARFAGQEIMGAFRERIDAHPGSVLKVRPQAGTVHLLVPQAGGR